MIGAIAVYSCAQAKTGGNGKIRMELDWGVAFSVLWLAAGICLSVLTGFRDNNEDYIYLVMVVSVMPPLFLDWSWIAYFLSLALFIYLIWQANRYFHWSYPVYEVEPCRIIIDKYGYQHYLYVREWKGRFIIGLDGEQEVDGNDIRFRTRWTKTFPDFATAEKEALRLSEKYYIQYGDQTK